MKNLIFLLALFGLFMVTDLSAQTRGYIGTDTLTVSSAVDTIYLYVADVDLADAKVLSRFDELELHIRLDSLSGATGGTLTIEYTYADSPTEIGAEWFTAAPATSLFTYMNGSTATTATSTSAYSFTVNGTRSILVWRDDNFKATYARARYVCPSSSQSTRMRGWYGLE
jgi:hypothetical protein